MANCGHVACVKCWTQWLARSDTCPTCREPTLMKNLTKIAYEDKSGLGIPTMTQICESDDDDNDNGDNGVDDNDDDDDDDDDDGELEIIGTKHSSIK